MKDIIYYYDKKTYRRYELGEIQSNFNMSFVIDGTKDSTKMVVFSFSEKEVEPYTIIKHELTNSWWIISNDKVERFENERTPLYKHTLQLLGAIEVLNARDLTDCAFRDNHYTISQAFFRLLSLSNLEFYFDDNFAIDIGVGQTQLDLDKNIDYIKTFENYTLLSAIRELFDSYNVAIKLDFEETSQTINNETIYYLKKLHFNLVSKTGNGNSINSNVFKDTRETKTMDKSSFGTTVVSNASNVVSTQSKTYPTIGAARLTGTTQKIENYNARLRVPSNIFNVNWIMVCRKQAYKIELTLNFVVASQQHIVQTFNLFYQYQNNSFNDSEWNKLINGYMQYHNSFSQEFLSALNTYFTNLKTQLFAILDKACRTTFYNCDRYDPANENFVAPSDNLNFYFPTIIKQYFGQGGPDYNGKAVLTPKEVKDSALNGNYNAIGWERDKDYIENFEMIGGADANDLTRINGYQSTDLRDSSYNSQNIFIDDSIVISVLESAYIKVNLGTSDELYMRINNTTYVINYVPMSDLKIKIDNSGDRYDTQLYNQNGKLTDSNALSKMLLSYSKEIESDNITKYAQFYDYNSVPKVGDITNINNVPYVINNVSLNFYQNEINSNNAYDKGYYIDCEFTLSRKIAVKSLMTNPNTNIRDYGIPQSYNIKRKQLYRDFYELSHTYDTNSSLSYYLPLRNVLNVSNFYKSYQEHIAVIKLEYGEEFGGDPDYSIDPQDKWYYQLYSSTYMLKKSIYEIIDFKDNNIIGHSALNVNSAFDVSKLLTGLQQMIDTPVQYTDDKGNFKSIEIAMCTSSALSDVYEEYQTYHNETSQSLMNASCFIDSEIFEGVNGEFSGAKHVKDFGIEENEYYKDALEVPVFEYSCQVDDSDDIIVGDNVLFTQEDDNFYFYTYLLAPKNTITDNNFTSLNIKVPQISVAPVGLKQSDSVVMRYEWDEEIDEKDYLKIKLFETTYWNQVTNEVTNENEIDLDSISLSMYDLVIVRNKINRGRQISESSKDLMFVIKNTNDLVIEDNEIVLSINHYKIK